MDFNELHVNRLPGYPKQEGNDLKILFYVRYPKGIESTEVGTFKVLPSLVLGRALREHKQYIEMALKIDLDLLERSDGVFSEKPKSSQSHMTTSSVIVVSLSVAGALFLSALIVG